MLEPPLAVGVGFLPAGAFARAGGVADAVSIGAGSAVALGVLTAGTVAAAGAVSFGAGILKAGVTGAAALASVASAAEGSAAMAPAAIANSRLLTLAVADTPRPWRAGLPPKRSAET